MRKTILIGMVGLLLGGAIGAIGGDAEAQRRRTRRVERRDDRRDHAVEALTGWNRLGERWVQHGAAGDHDVITAAGEGRFRRIMLRVEHSAIELFDVVVTFGDGTTFSPTTRLVFAPGTTTRTIDLPGDARIIRRVDFKFRNLPGGGRAQVELWAR
jgi:hypothetical protein